MVLGLDCESQITVSHEVEYEMYSNIRARYKKKNLSNVCTYIYNFIECMYMYIYYVVYHLGMGFLARN
jgi:hypothetical protein